MPLATALCLGKLCASSATLLGAVGANAPIEHVKDICESLIAGTEAAAKLRGPETKLLTKALRAAQAKLESAYANAFRNDRDPAYRDQVDTAFANLDKIYDSCLPAAADLVRLRHDPASIAAHIANQAVLHAIDIFRDGEPRQLLVKLLELAYATLDKDTAFRGTLERLNWKQTFDQLAELKSGLGSLASRVDIINSKIDRVLDFNDKQHPLQDVAAGEIWIKRLRQTVARTGIVGIPDANLLAFLDKWIAAVLATFGRQMNEDTAFVAALREAERRLRTGTADPIAALMDELAREEREERDRQKEHNRRRIALLEAALREAERRLRTDAAGALMDELAHEKCEECDHKEERNRRARHLWTSNERRRRLRSRPTRSRTPLPHRHRRPDRHPHG